MNIISLINSHHKMHQKKAYRIKEFITPSGNKLLCQGYEHFALNYLLNSLQIEENNIITKRSFVPEMWYYGLDGKNTDIM